MKKEFKKVKKQWKKSLNVSMWVRELKAEEGRKFVKTQKKGILFTHSAYPGNN